MSSTGALMGTYGWSYLMDGFPFISIMIGLFVIPEIFNLMERKFIIEEGALPRHSYKEILYAFKETVTSFAALIRSVLIGVGIGAIPAAGATIASLVSYNQSKIFNKERIKDEKENRISGIGIICAEAANSSSQGGAMATMLVLGIPGGMASAVLIGAIIYQGWVPGPSLMLRHLDVIYGVIWAMLLSAIILLPSGIVLAYYSSKIIFIKTNILVPIITVFVVAGSYSINYNFNDVFVLLIFGLIGFFMKKYNYPLIALILGLLLGPMVNSELLRTYQRYAGDFSVFFTRPISLSLIVINVGLILYYYMKKNRK